jgi:rhodanese-related sulfurtransferase
VNVDRRQPESPGRLALLREAGLLLAVACALALAFWALDPGRLPLRAQEQVYAMKLAAPLVSVEGAHPLFEEGAFFLDTRPVALSEVPHIPGAFPLRSASFADDLQAAADFIMPDDLLVLYGEPNLQEVSALAARLQERGYLQLRIMGGGLAAWRQAGYPISDPAADQE